MIDLISIVGPSDENKRRIENCICCGITSYSRTVLTHQLLSLSYVCAYIFFFFEERSLMHCMKGKSGTTRKLTSIIIIIISFLKVDFYIIFYNFKKPITVKSIQCTVGSDFSPVNRIAHDQVKITWIRNGNMSHFITNRLDLPNRHAFDGRFHVKWRKAKKLPFKENANPIISSHMLSIVSLCNQS